MLGEKLAQHLMHHCQQWFQMDQQPCNKQTAFNKDADTAALASFAVTKWANSRVEIDFRPIHA